MFSNAEKGSDPLDGYLSGACTDFKNIQLERN